MELPCEILGQIAFNTRPKIEEHMLIVMDKSTREEHLSQPLQTKNKQFKTAVMFPTGYNCVFSVANKNNKFCFTVSINDDVSNVISIPSGASELESLNDEIKRNVIKEGYFTEAD